MDFLPFVHIEDGSVTIDYTIYFWILGIWLFYRIAIREQIFGCGPFYRKIAKYPDIAYDLFSKAPNWHINDFPKSKETHKSAVFYVPKLKNKKIITYFEGSLEEMIKSEKNLMKTLIEISERLRKITREYYHFTNIYKLNLSSSKEQTIDNMVYNATTIDAPESKYQKRLNRKEKALDGIINLALMNPYNDDVVKKYKINKEKLKKIFLELEKQNAGFTIESHYLSLACISYPETLEFIFSKYPFDYSEGEKISKRLWIYFKNKRVGEI